MRQSTTTFCRLVVHGSEDLLVDIGLDSPPRQPATASFLGPTFAPEELAGRKLLALFDRAEARDFADVYVLLQTYTKSQLLSWANDIDAGFDTAVLAEQLGTLRRFLDSDLPVERAATTQLRQFFEDWRHELD
ncbi:MAG TPA: nucleotidyl transferase AbiEii/AbiGii toxin family protein [Candidatus Nanopelagicales bacterium]